MASCSQCVTSEPGLDDNIQGPLGIKYDDHDDRLDVVLAIPGVKKPGPFSRGVNRSCVVNANFQAQSLRVLVELTSEKVLTRSQSTFTGKYLFKIKKLPEKVNPEACSFRLGKNKVVITLRKAHQGSWRHILDTKGLESADDL